MNWRRQIGILALYGALSLVMTMPVVTQLNTHIAGQGGDPWQTLWRFSHKQDMWQTAQNTGHKTQFLVDEFFGGGAPRLVNISVWPWMGLHVLFGQPAAYNLVYLLSFMLSGYFMYLLVGHLVVRHSENPNGHPPAGGPNPKFREAASFLAGLLYMFLPFHVAHALGHFGAMQTQWLPLATLLLCLWFERATIWRTLGLAAVLAVQSWSEHHYMLWFAIFAAFFVIFHWRSRPANTPGESARRAPYFVLLLILAGIFAILPWTPTVRLAAQGGSGLSLGQEQTIRFSSDLFSYVVPPSWQPLWGKVAHELFGKHFTGNLVEATQFLGWLPLLLLAFFQRRVPRRQKIFWLTVAAIFIVISLGPRLHVFGRVLGFPLPYALVDSWPILSAVRVVARAGAFVGLAVSVLFGWVLARELKRPISSFLVAAIIIFEFLFLPVPMADINVSDAYAEIAQLPGKALVEIPAATNYTVASQALFTALIHGKEVVGSVALERAEGADPTAFVRTLPGLRQLLFLRTDHLMSDHPDFFNQDLDETLPDVLRYLDVGAIAVRVDSLSAKQREAVQYFLEERMRAAGEKHENVVLYRIDPSQYKGFGAGDGIFLTRDRGWGGVGLDAARGNVFAEIPRQASVTLYNVSAGEKRVELAFRVERGSIRVLDTIVNAGEARTIVVEVPRGTRDVKFENVLPELAVLRDLVMTVR